MLPSQTIDPDNILPPLTVRQMRAINADHEPAFTFLRPDGPAGRGWRCDCSCGVALLPHRSMDDALAAHQIHVSAAHFDARRAIALAAATTAGGAR